MKVVYARPPRDYPAAESARDPVELTKLWVKPGSSTPLTRPLLACVCPITEKNRCCQEGHGQVQLFSNCNIKCCFSQRELPGRGYFPHLVMPENLAGTREIMAVIAMISHPIPGRISCPSIVLAAVPGNFHLG